MTQIVATKVGLSGHMNLTTKCCTVNSWNSDLPRFCPYYIPRKQAKIVVVVPSKLARFAQKRTEDCLFGPSREEPKPCLEVKTTTSPCILTLARRFNPISLHDLEYRACWSTGAPSSPRESPVLSFRISSTVKSPTARPPN